MSGKVVSLREAVRRFVPDGASVAMGTALEALIPFAAGHEIIRLGKRDLTLIGPISDMLFDQLIGAGCVSTVRAAWVGNVSGGLGHNYRRAAERGMPRPVRTEDHSNFSISLGLLAGALGAPYIPTHSLLGTDIVRANPAFKEERSPFGGEPVVLVPAIVPDVAILHVQRCDEDGNAHAWGNLGVTREALMAARATIITAEELVSREVIKRDPNRVLGPSDRVMAVVPQRLAAHPSPVQGYYGRDHAAFHEYHEKTRTEEGWQRWLRWWVLAPEDREAYLKLLGEERLAALQPRERAYAAPVDYGR